MDDSAVISVHWWVTMALLCMLALNSREKVKKKKKSQVFLRGSQGEGKKKKESASTSKNYATMTKLVPQISNTSVVTEN